MSRWGKPRKNKKRIDPRYFLNEMRLGGGSGAEPKHPEEDDIERQKRERKFSIDDLPPETEEDKILNKFKRNFPSDEEEKKSPWNLPKDHPGHPYNDPDSSWNDDRRKGLHNEACGEGNGGKIYFVDISPWGKLSTINLENAIQFAETSRKNGFELQIGQSGEEKTSQEVLDALGIGTRGDDEPPLEE